MSSVPVAAFDPIFWLHHSNIDRIIYLWQLIPANKDKWFNAARGDEDDDANAPLRPFRNPKRPIDFYDSNMVRSLTDLNYTYDDVLVHSQSLGLPFDMPFDASFPNEIQLAKRINGLYGDGLPDVSPPQGVEHPGAEKVDFIVNVVYNRCGPISSILLYQNTDILPQLRPQWPSVRDSCLHWQRLCGEHSHLFHSDKGCQWYHPVSRMRETVQQGDPLPRTSPHLARRQAPRSSHRRRECGCIYEEGGRISTGTVELGRYARFSRRDSEDGFARCQGYGAGGEVPSAWDR